MNPTDTKLSTTTESHESCMLKACEDARTGVTQGHGGPFGAMVRHKDGDIVAVSHNTVLMDGDPSCHAEINAIRQACETLQRHDLSDCEFFTTCEPCPMCLGGIMWSGVRTMYVGVDRHTAANYGFDDKIFYEELDAYVKNMSVLKMVDVKSDILANEIISQLFLDERVNPQAGKFRQNGKKTSATSSVPFAEDHVRYMRLAMDAAKEGAQKGANLDREPFGACVVNIKTGEAIAVAWNSVTVSRDSTATAEVNAIRAATKKLETHNLEDCVLYSTTQPDLMSFTVVLWARISKIYYGVSQEVASVFGYKLALFHLLQACEIEENRTELAIVPGLCKDACEDVFKMWKMSNGELY